MRLFIALVALAHSTHGFVAPQSSHRASLTTIAMSSAAEEAALRAGAGAAGLKPVPPPKLFDEDLLTDMRECLLKLERRVNEGPGALSMLEVEEFDFATKRIVKEMKLNENNRPKPARAFPDGLPPTPDAAAAAPATTAAPPQPQHAAIESDPQNIITDTSMDEGPSFDIGKGGMGLAKGTTNTYIIPGMDEMSPEEYQAALQKSISDRQARRVSQGSYGNRNSNDYLNNLNPEGLGTGPTKQKNKKAWNPKDV